MFIDLHCHTKNAKKSDTKREVGPATFLNAMSLYGVGIVAITNHNLFCREQFDEFSSLDNNLLVWPGIELDVLGNKSEKIVRGHVILISNPKYVDSFEAALIEAIGSSQPDDFCISIDEVANLINSLKECLVICHHKKNPELSSADLLFLRNSLNGDKIVLLEPGNARNAALIYYENEGQSWFGSDVTDWDHYPNNKADFKLPECKFNIHSFERFFYLLKKNRGTVLANGYLDPKKSDLIHLSPFNDLTFDYQLFNDVNIIFGGKATAKTTILEKLEEYYLSKSKNVATFYVERKRDSLQQLVDKRPTESLIASFNNCSSKADFDFFKNWKWSELPSPVQYFKCEELSQKNAIINRLRINKAVFSDALLSDLFVSARLSFSKSVQKINAFLSLNYKEYLSADEASALEQLVNKVLAGEESKYRAVAVDYYSKYLEKWSIHKIKSRFSTASATISRPASVGLTTFFADYTGLKKHLDSVKQNLSHEEVVKPYPTIGSIPFRGDIRRKVLVGFPPQKQPEHKEKTGGGRKYLNNQTLTNYNLIKAAINGIKLDLSTDKISEAVSIFTTKLSELKVDSLSDFLNYSTFLTTDYCDDFLPSNGVTSILLVEAALQNDDADVIILDEPDSGMGADFINTELITKINDRAKENKIIIVATHDPNLVVRTHPYSCLYREEISNGEYVTYYGSSFDEELVDIFNENNKKSWVDACVEKCEGGHEALDERLMTYGK